MYSKLEMTGILPKGFVYLSDIDNSIVQDIRYASSENFIGRPIAGYNKPIAIITEVAALKLKEVQNELLSRGLSLKIFDAYRPQAACDDFWNWAHDGTDLKMKDFYYPSFENKVEIFNAGYIARYSTHSRGSTVDLTIIDNVTKNELDMGGPFDFFGDVSMTAYEGISDEAKANRILLKQVMEKHGFENYSNEWWHFSLLNEPFPNKPQDHFNFPIE